MKKQENGGKSSGFRFTPEDLRILAALKKRLGVDQSSIVRLALRALCLKEGIEAV